MHTATSQRDPGLRRRGAGAALSGAVLAAALGLLAAGCGKKGPPLPPAPRGPLPPLSVSARQIGTLAEVRFQVPAARGSKPAQQPERGELLRVVFAPGVQPSTDPEVFRRRGELIDSIEGDPLRSGARQTLTDRSLAELPGGGAEHTVRYAVRVRDRRNRPSALVVTKDLVPLSSAAAPERLEAEPTADGVRLVWAGPGSDGSLRYNVYRAAPGALEPESPLNTEPLTVPEYLDETVVTGERYVYFVRVALAEGTPYREGETGQPLEVVAEDRFAPEAPRGIVAVQEGTAVRLFWDPNRERDLAGYRVYRRNGSAAEWIRIGPDPVQRPLYLDGDVRTGDRPAYRVTAVDRSDPPNESLPSETVRLELLTEPVAPGGPGRR